MREITVARTFNDFEDLWASVQIGVSMAQATREMSAEENTQFADASGRITYTSRANAVTGRVPA